MPKVCWRCGQRKPASEFHKDNHSSDGLQRGCKECDRERSVLHGRTLKGRYNLLKSKGTDLTREEHATLLGQLCFYCEGPLNKSGTGLDRILPKGGYVKNNVIPCCWGCNMCKSDRFSYSEMVIIGRTIKQVLNHRHAGSEQSPNGGDDGSATGDCGDVVGVPVVDESEGVA